MKKIFAFLKNLFRNLKALAEKFVKPSVIVVENLKKAVESPLAPVITAIIPGTWDDKIVEKLKQHLPRILQILKISEECLKLTKAEDIILCAINKLKEYSPEARSANYHSIAALLSVALSDKKITWREAIHLSEEIYHSLGE